MGEDICCFKESSSVMNRNSACEKLSISPESSDLPFRDRDENLSKSIDSPVVSQNNLLDASMGSAILAKAYEERYEGRDTISIDDASERKYLDAVCMSPLKSDELKGLKSQSQDELSENKAPIHLKSSNVSRRRRNMCSKPAQPSVWRSLGNSLNGSEQNDEVELVQQEPRVSRRSNGDQKSEKQERNQLGQCLHKPIKKNHISLKVKFGNRCLMDVLPLIENGNEINSSTRKGPSQFADDTEKDFTTTMKLDGLSGSLSNSLVLSDVPVSKTHLAGNSISEGMAEKPLEGHPESSSLLHLEKLGTTVDSRCSDPGTSPDSEVINSTPDAPVSLKSMENSPDLISNQTCFYSRGVSSLGTQEKGPRKGKKKNRAKKTDRIDKASDISVKGTFPSLAIINNELIPNGSNSGYSSALTTTVSASGTMFSTDSHSEVPLPPSISDDVGISNAISEFELGEKVNLCCRLDAESPESQRMEMSLSSPGKCNLPKSRAYQGVGKSQSNFCNSSRSASKRKGTKEKMAEKCEEKENTHTALDLGGVKNSSKTDNRTPSLIEENDSGKGNTGLCVSNQSDMRKNHVPPRNAWVQCDDCHKWRRISASLADKIDETNCRWICEDNIDKKFADCSIPQVKSNSEINLELEISDMSGEEDAIDVCRKSDNSSKNTAVPQSSTWTLIKSNLFLQRSRKSQTIDEIMTCHCKPPSDGRAGCGNGCLNRMLNIECIQGTCPCGDQCSNQQFQRRSYANVKWIKCGKKGYGLQLLEDVSEGCFIIEYVGEVLDMHAHEARQKEYALKGHKHFYFMTLNGSEVIDACAKGNLGRFINHSCDPNCRTEKWMVNGEVCIGLFATRDIKKGEELTFDYNYVRVFGAAAKKCVCGAPQCRGYIGGDPESTEIIVQDDSDDEYPEPAVICEEEDMYVELNNIKSAANFFRGSENRTTEEPTQNKEKCCAVECLKDTEENGDMLNISASSTQPLETSSPSGDITSETNCEDKAEKDLKHSLCSSGEMEVASTSGILIKPLRRPKSGTSGRKVPVEKTSRSSPSVKKSTTIVVNIRSQAEMDKPNILQDKSKKLAEGSSNGRFEAVEEKLNELLDVNGGIRKNKDASRCYLKLLVLTAASGDSGNGGAIQSNRELSMILGALLKTKSRTVLVDIINKNGLQMLHNIMKRYRREFNKTPILRKLLKVLEYLALKDILTVDHINGVPSRSGVESLRDSILALTEHLDKQVHQTARNFRDRWIPKPLRKNNCVERDHERAEFRASSHSDRYSDLHNHSLDCHERTSEAAGCNSQDGKTSISNHTKTRKRKSRWDLVPEINGEDDDTPPGYEFPPGFSPPIEKPREHCTVTGQCQQRFISRLSVSYGIPFNIVQQFGVPVNGSSENWATAPGMPFHPYPPLPSYSRDKTHVIPSPCTSGSNPNRGSESGKRHQRSGVLGRKYFRQQKWRKSCTSTGLISKTGTCDLAVQSTMMGSEDTEAYIGKERLRYPSINT